MSSIVGAKKRRVGFVGYGMLGKNLVSMVLNDKLAQNLMELCFVVDLFCPESVLNDPTLPQECKATSLDNWEQYGADLIVEVAHPAISKNYGEQFLKSADYLIASTTAFADLETEIKLKAAANKPGGRGIYMCSGALFGSIDIQSMSDSGKLAAMCIVMKKHPLSLYPTVESEQFSKNEYAKTLEGGEVELYNGNVRQLAALFPRNVNTICTAACAAWSSIGLDGTKAIVIADASLEKMVIQVHLEGPKNPAGTCLTLDINRESPAPKDGAVTSQATVTSFLNSLIKVASNPSKGNGIHFC